MPRHGQGFVTAPSAPTFILGAVGEDKLDNPSQEVANSLSEATQLLEESAGLLEGIPDDQKDDRQQLYRAESAIASPNHSSSACK
jgi:hypothetical protein